MPLPLQSSRSTKIYYVLDIPRARLSLSGPFKLDPSTSPFSISRGLLIFDSRPLEERDNPVRGETRSRSPVRIQVISQVFALLILIQAISGIPLCFIGAVVV
ncbi:hypothetical protein RIF29_25466 [Crotalaria pallida]|uniref:Uncharacterized protein n=1 Tax=Crotalaria pallida TaxID=3830 RepID=A0AAN9EMB0_CROPI